MYTTKIYQQQCWKEWTGCFAQEDVPNSVISPPKLADVLLNLLRVGMAWCFTGTYHSTILVFFFLETHHHEHKASNHPNISNLMYHIYMQHPPTHKHFLSLVHGILLSMYDSWAASSSLTNFSLSWKTATLLALVTDKHCSDLTVLCIANN